MSLHFFAFEPVQNLDNFLEFVAFLPHHLLPFLSSQGGGGDVDEHAPQVSSHLP